MQAKRARFSSPHSPWIASAIRYLRAAEVIPPLLVLVLGSSRRGAGGPLLALVLGRGWLTAGGFRLLAGRFLARDGRLEEMFHRILHAFGRLYPLGGRTRLTLFPNRRVFLGRGSLWLFRWSRRLGFWNRATCIVSGGNDLFDGNGGQCLPLVCRRCP